VIRCAPGTSLPVLRTIALEKSRGDIIIVTEDHCIPRPGWLEAVLRAFRDHGEAGAVVAVGGPVVNLVADRALDQATFLCEYAAFMPPLAEGIVCDLPGMNVAYRREALERLPRDLLESGFWETVAHPVLRANRGQFQLCNAMVMGHAKRFSPRLFLGQRFLYSRYYAGRRFPRDAILSRLATALATPLLPALLSWRLLTAVAARGVPSALVWSALPWLLLFYCVWAAGEAVGYVAGGGDALVRIE
jgi:hypothetical protein